MNCDALMKARDATCLSFPRYFSAYPHMPTSARKSSLGASRRAQQRAHLPFRADDLGRGKRTGLPVPTIETKSDDFEPFDKILSHADTRTAWHGQNKRPGSNKKRKSVAPVSEDDEAVEMSMEVDDYGEGVMSSYSLPSC
jgi:centromere protein C